jgi:hypothetical protein
MSIQGANRPKPAPWSRKAKALIEEVGRTESAESIGIGAGLLSALHNGSRLTSPQVVTEATRWAADHGVTLTPTDLGRPDLNQSRKVKA